jgi:hypothetical protein
MRASAGFALGAVTGAVVIWCWGGGHPQAAPSLRTGEEAAGKADDCGTAHGAARRTTASEDWSYLIVGLVGLAARLWCWHRDWVATSAVRSSAAG